MFNLCGCMHNIIIIRFQKGYKQFTNPEDFLAFSYIIITIFLRVVDVQSDSMITSNIASAVIDLVYIVNIANLWSHASICCMIVMHVESFSM